MTFIQVLHQFGFSFRLQDYAHEYCVIIGRKHYRAYLSPDEDSVKWQGYLIHTPEEFLSVLNKWMIEIILES